MGCHEEYLLAPVDHEVFDHAYSVIAARHLSIHGSDCCEPLSHVSVRGVCSIQQLWHMANGQLQGAEVHLVELFGGKGMTSYMLARGHDLVSGQNFDIVAGFDLNKPSDIDFLYKYVRLMKPLVVIMSPPCRAFCKIRHLNQVLHPETTYRLSRQEGEHLANVCLKVASMQLESNRHFLIEQPHGSDLYQLPGWAAIGRKVVKCVFDQCQVGLRSPKPPHLPIRKRTELWASHELLLKKLRSRQCAGHHKHAGVSQLNDKTHGVASRVCQEWPPEFCRILASSVADLVGSAKMSYAVAETRFMACPGCRWHKRKDHESHIRRGDCLHKDVKTKIWRCPACVLNKPRAHETHKLDDTCQWSVARDMPTGASRERSGGDVRVPASREPTSQLRLGPSTAEPSRGGSRGTSYTPVARCRDSAAQVVNGGMGEVSSASGIRRDVDAQSSDQPSHSAQGVPANPGASREAAVEARPDDAQEVREADWTRFDLGHALQRLRSHNEAVVRRALRQLHVRFYHPSTQRLRGLLAAAGVEPRILELVSQITDTCSICRAWTRPTAKAIASSHLPTSFNEELQVDLLFILDKTVLHVLDACTRFCVAKVIPDKQTETLLDALQQHWLSLFGPPLSIVSDQEGGLSSPAGAAWMSRRDIKFLPKARYAHANMVERHHALLRHQFHLLRDQTLEDGLRVSFEAVLAECVFVKNAMMRIGNSTPYQAVLGRVPHMLDVVDAEAGPDIEAKDSNRVRTKAIASMVQATSAAKLERASKHKTRMTGELLELTPGEQIDYWRQPSTKDHSGWLGPATVVDVTTIPQGHVSVRFQGRVLICRVQDIRRSLMYPVLMTREPLNTPVGVIRHTAESLYKQVVRLGWFSQLGTWRTFDSNAAYPVEVIAGLHLAACNLQFSGVISFRLGNSVPSLPAVACDMSLLLFWDIGHLDSWSVAYIPGTNPVNFERMCHKSCEGIAFVQFFAVDSETLLSIRGRVDDVPNLGGPHDPHLPPLHDVTQQVTMRQAQRALENEVATDQTGPEAYDIFTPQDTSSREVSTQPEARGVC